MSNINMAILKHSANEAALPPLTAGVPKCSVENNVAQKYATLAKMIDYTSHVLLTGAWRLGNVLFSFQIDEDNWSNMI
jgi:hypothetical protein